MSIQSTKSVVYFEIYTAQKHDFDDYIIMLRVLARAGI